MSDQQDFSDDELLRLYKNPQSDLSLLSSTELKRLDTLTTPASAPTIPRDARGMPRVSSDVQEGGPSLFQRTVQGMVNPSPEMQLGMDVLPFAAGAIGPGISRLRGAPPMAVSHGATPVRDWIRGAGSAMEQAPSAGASGRFVGRLMQKVPTPQTFQDIPLAQQMEQLPSATPAPVTGRLAMAPHQVTSDATMLKSLMQESSTALNPWESNFLESVSGNISSGRALTPGQSNALRGIYLRANMPR